MARRRKYREDLTYSEEHRRRLPELYGRIGHRQDMADRDFTEFCHYCKRPIAIIEEVRDVGQDLTDKATTITHFLASRAGIPAWLVAWRVERPPEVERRLDELHREQRQLEAEYPIVEIAAGEVHGPRANRIRRLTPEEWWTWLLIQHRQHHDECRRATEFPVNGARLRDVRRRHPLHTTRTPQLFDDA